MQSTNRNKPKADQPAGARGSNTPAAAASHSTDDIHHIPCAFAPAAAGSIQSTADEAFDGVLYVLRVLVAVGFVCSGILTGIAIGATIYHLMRAGS